MAFFYVVIAMGTQGLPDISCPGRDQADQGRFLGLMDQADLPLGSLATRSQCLVPVVLLQVVLLLVALSPAVQGQ